MPYARETIACNGILRLKYVIIKQQKKTNQCKHLAQKFMYKLLWYSREMTRFNSNIMLTHLMESSCFSSARSIHSSVSNGVSQLKFRQFLFVRRRQKVNQENSSETNKTGNRKEEMAACYSPESPAFLALKASFPTILSLQLPNIYISNPHFSKVIACFVLIYRNFPI